MAKVRKAFNFFSDPGHGWLRVKLDDLIEVNMTVKDFSNYSYIKNDNVYLEEDCDAPIFIDRWKQKYDVVRFNEKHSNRASKIRSYDHLHSNTR